MEKRSFGAWMIIEKRRKEPSDVWVDFRTMWNTHFTWHFDFLPNCRFLNARSSVLSSGAEINASAQCVP